jgi:hypothetical protein
MIAPPGYPVPPPPRFGEQPGGYPAGFAGPPGPQPIPVTARVEPVPGTEFGLAYFTVPPTTSGQAVGSLVTGIASILVSMVVGCLGFGGAKDGWGPLVGGAFAILAALAGAAGIGLGWFALGQIRRSAGRLTGRGIALAGMSCGAVGLGLTALAMVLALLI